MDINELVIRCKNGDRDAFNILVSAYQGKVVNIAFGMLSNKEDAVDAAQETFIRVYRAIDGFNEKSSLSTWIYRICQNVCNDMLRKRQRTITGMPIDGSPEDEEQQRIEPVADGADPEERFIRNERQAAIREAIAGLKKEYREVITLFDLNGMSYDEISKILRLPVGTVKSRLSRAREALRKKLLEKRELF